MSTFAYQVARETESVDTTPITGQYDDDAQVWTGDDNPVTASICSKSDYISYGLTENDFIYSCLIG